VADVKRFEALDGLRGICALSVVIFHFDTVFHTGRLLNHAYLAVDVFFLLSGFVIAHVYEARMEAGIGAFQFLKARAARLLPVHFLGTAVVSLTAIALWSFGTLPLPGFTALTVAAAMVAGLLLIPQYFVVGEPFPLNPVLWSLWGEWLANIAYALGAHRMRTALLLAIVVSFWSVGIWHAFHNPLGWMAGMDQFDIIGVVARAMGGFFAGVCLLRAYRRGYLAKLPSLSPEVVFAMWLMVSAVPAPSITPGFDIIVAIVIAPLAVALLARSEKATPRIFVALGDISYPLYASHLALVAAAAAFTGKTTGAVGYLYAGLLTLAALVLAWIIARVADALRYQMKTAPVGAPSP
jgi:peptidoglycan/LPS O-acetylase OafA/YrhL